MEPRRASGGWVFKETDYLLSSCVSEDLLEVTVEETVSGYTWRGKFEAKHIEELTRKTGNYKQFLVFTTMLESAIGKSNDCVTLDLLTYSDLESLRERRNAMAATGAAAGGGSDDLRSSARPANPPETSPGKRYLILTYSVEFDRIHYPLALSFAGQADSGRLRETVSRLAAELERCKKQGKKNSALAKLQKEYDGVLREKEELREAVEALQAQLMAVEGGAGDRKQLKVLQEVIRNLEEEVLQERTKHQRYVSRKTEEMRALTQELGELRSSERTLRSRVKNLTNELALLKKGLRYSPSGHLRPRHTPPSTSFKKTPSSSSGPGGQLRQQRQRSSNSGSLDRKRESSNSGSMDRRRERSNPGSLNRRRESSNSGSLDRRRERSGSHEKRLALGVSNSRMRTPSPRGVGGGRWMKFDPSAYVENKRRQQKESQERFQRLRSPSYHGSGTHSRSSSLEKPHHLHHRSSSLEKPRHHLHHRSSSGGSVGRPPLQPRSGSRIHCGGVTEGLRGARTRSSSLGSLSGRSSRGSSPASSRGSYRRPSLSDLEPSPPSSVRGRPRASSNRNKSKKLAGSSGRRYTSTPTSSGKAGNKNSSLLDHSAEMSEIDARLNALQQFMKRSLEATKSTSTRR